MVGGKPYKTYSKTIMGRVFITVLNMLTGNPTPEGVILSGDQRKDEPSSYYSVFSEQEDIFFRKMNRRHFEQGILIEKVLKEASKERTVEEYTDEELKAQIAKPFLALQHLLNSVKTVATLYRIQTLAREMEKSEKVMKAIESRLSEVQEAGAIVAPSTIEEEL
jgi:N-methylhydantoinase B/oxoprolinase/acetone carboxylase alpha subunit